MGLPAAYAVLGRAIRNGTEERDSTALMDVWAGLGATHGASFGPDGGFLSAEVGAADFDEAMALLAETATRPRLEAASFGRLRAACRAVKGGERRFLRFVKLEHATQPETVVSPEILPGPDPSPTGMITG